jgi:hypothetical protein
MGLILLVNNLRSKLKKLSEPPSSFSLANLVDLCYSTRGPIVDQLKGRSINSEDDFGKLAHYIGRMGATRSSANTVVRSVEDVLALRQISCIRTVKAPDIRVVTVDQTSLSPYEIVWRICQTSQFQNPLQMKDSLHAIVDHDLPGPNGLRVKLARQTTILTRVHAELQIADRFSRDSLGFVGNDKFIGCSKPACYFCYIWLDLHRHDYILPDTHNKIILGCRGPDNDINDSGATVLKEMFAKVSGRLGADIFAFLLEDEGHASRRHQAMSTEGSSYAPSRV